MTQYVFSKQIFELLKVKGGLEKLKGSLAVKAVLRTKMLLDVDLPKLSALKICSFMSL